MTPIESQVAYFMAKMPSRTERRLWVAHFKHRAKVLEKDFPEYAGLLEALEAALKSQRFDSK